MFRLSLPESFLNDLGFVLIFLPPVFLFFTGGVGIGTKFLTFEDWKSYLKRIGMVAAIVFSIYFIGVFFLSH